MVDVTKIVDVQSLRFDPLSFCVDCRREDKADWGVFVKKRHGISRVDPKTQPRPCSNLLSFFQGMVRAGTQGQKIFELL